MFHLIEKQIREAVSAYIRQNLSTDVPVGLEQPKQSSFGELALPVAFQIAKTARKAPKVVAAELVSGLGPIPGVSALEIAGNGYINIRLERASYGASLLPAQVPTDATGDKIVVEHTNINPNKAAISATCATRFLVTPSSVCSVPQAGMSKCRTTSTTPESRSPTSSLGSISSSRKA